MTIPKRNLVRPSAALFMLALLVGTAVFASSQTTGHAQSNPTPSTIESEDDEPKDGEESPGNRDGHSEISLVSQTAFVSPQSAFDLIAQISTDQDPASLDFVVTVYSPARNRSAFNQSLEGNNLGTTQILQRRRLTDGLSPENRIAVQLPINDPNDRETYLSTPGVYPVHLELRPTGSEEAVARLITHIIKSPTEEPRKLSVGTAFPVNVASNPNDQFAAPSNGREYNELVAIRASHPTVPLLNTVSAEGFERVEALQNAASQTSISSLQTAFGNQDHFLQTWAPMPQLAAKSLPGEHAKQLDRAAKTSARATGKRPVTETWLGFDPLTTETISAMQARGTERLVVHESNLSPINRATSIARPIKIRNGGRATIDAFQGDSALTRHFATGGTLGAHHLLADLTVIQNDFPGQTRGAIAMAPSDWELDSAFLNAFLSGLSNSPELQPANLDDLFSLPFDGSNRSPTTRELTLAKTDAPESPNELPVQSIEQLRKRLNSFDSMTQDNNPVFDRLTRHFLYAQSTRLLGKSREEVLRTYESTFGGVTSSIRLPTERSIRLTSSRGEIPVSIQNDTGYPVSVKLRMTSDQVSFPGGKDQTVEVERQQTTQRVLVESRTSGRFRAQISITSPDGELQLASTKINIISTSTSLVGMILTFGSLGFLVIWWISSIINSHRKKKRRHLAQ